MKDSDKKLLKSQILDLVEEAFGNAEVVEVIVEHDITLSDKQPEYIGGHHVEFYWKDKEQESGN